MRLSKIFLMICSAFVLWAANPPGVPKEARQTAPGEYSFKDRDGKAWIYRQTPFGIQKAPDKGAEGSGTEARGAKPGIATETKSEQAKDAVEAKAAAAPGTPMPTPFGETKSRGAIPVRVTEDGETLRFERQTPFGVQRWTKNKTELTEVETQLWEAQRNQTRTK